MAIFIFLRLPFHRSRCLVHHSALAAAMLAFVTHVGAAGYVVSTKDREQAATLAQQAFTSYQAGDYGQALQLLKRADQLRPDQPDAWNLRGVVLLKQKSFDQAQVAFARAAALDPALWAAQFNLAETSFQRRDYAQARTRFERLLSQTDRFKERSKWELVQYKDFLSCLLMGDDATANKKLAKLPAKDGATPAFFYAQAALSYSRKNPAQAEKSLVTAQTAYPASMNGLFVDSLVQAGWQQAPAPAPMLASAANVPMYPPGSAPTSLPGNGQAAVVIDPALQAASAGPLPVSDAPVQPVFAPVRPMSRQTTTSTPATTQVAEASPARSHAAPNTAVQVPPAVKSDLGTSLENGGLLLEE